MNHTIVFVVAVTSLALLGAGCSPTETVKTPSKPAGESAPSRQSLPTGVELPADFPVDVLQYPESKVISFLQDGTPGHALLSLSSGDQSADVLAWYEREYVQAGFAKGASATRGDTTSREYLMGGVKMVVTVIDQAATSPKTPSLISVRRSAVEPNP
jgi:hypothetical protein